MRRRLLRFGFNAVAILSLLLCAGVCALWWQSFPSATEVEFAAGGRLWSLSSHGGMLRLSDVPQREMEVLEGYRERLRMAALALLLLKETIASNERWVAAGR